MDLSELSTSEIEQKKNELDKLKLLLKLKEKEIKNIKEEINVIKKKLLPYTNSQTAKNGYKEEELVCNDLCNPEIRNYFSPILGNDYHDVKRIPGTHKSDIQSNDRQWLAQVKKSKHDQFQQLDRHSIDSFIENIPELNSGKKILKEIFEYPLKSNGTHVDKTNPLKKLSIPDYSQEELDKFFILLNHNKKKIVEFGFYGPNLEKKPDYLFSVQYVGKKRDHILLFKIEKIVEYLLTLNFKISSKKTGIILGDNRTISLQRKGGDSEKKSSNDLQIKIILSNLIDKVHNLEYKL